MPVADIPLILDASTAVVLSAVLLCLIVALQHD
jgi:hypothetical protein